MRAKIKLFFEELLYKMYILGIVGIMGNLSYFRGNVGLPDCPV
jgi:hypothetical protein